MIDNNLNIDWLLQNSTYNPERIAIINTSIKLTFRELNQIVDNTSRLLNDAGIKDNQHCALISENNLEWVKNKKDFYFISTSKLISIYLDNLGLNYVEFPWNPIF